LIHGTIFMLISIPLPRWGWSIGPRVFVYFAVIPLVVLFAWWFYRHVEEPAHLYARRALTPAKVHQRS
jgi:peptidoglycan/LPS O-acetylase OafA/YrhL